MVENQEQTNVGAMQSDQIQWEYDLGKDISETFVAALVKNGQVLFHSKGSLFSLDCESGEESWSIELPSVSDTKMLLMTDDFLVVQTVAKKGPKNIRMFDDHLHAVGFDGELLWSLKLPTRMASGGFLKDGSRLWVLGPLVGNKGKQLLHHVDLKSGAIAETRKLPHQATRMAALGEGFAFFLDQTSRNHSGMYSCDGNMEAVTVINQMSTHEVFYSEGCILCSVGQYPDVALKIIDADTHELRHQRSISTGSTVFDGELIYFLEQREATYLSAMDLAFNVKWSTEVPEDAEMVLDSGECISICLDYEYMIFSKANGEVLSRIEAYSIPKVIGAKVYVKAKNRFVKMK